MRNEGLSIASNGIISNTWGVSRFPFTPTTGILKSLLVFAWISAATPLITSSGMLKNCILGRARLVPTTAIGIAGTRVAEVLGKDVLNCATRAVADNSSAARW